MATSVPVHYVHPDTMHLISEYVTTLIVDRVRKEGLNPDDTILICQELGNGELAIGVFPKEERNPNPGNVLIGYVVPWGFWRTNDGRVTEGAMTTHGPSLDYKIPVDQVNIALVSIK